jgi:ribosome-binding factor A
MTRRIDRINDLLREEISRIIASELRDPRLPPVVSITRVEVSQDLHYAKVFVSVMGDREGKLNALKALKSASGFIHRNARRNLALKTVPTFEFVLDESIERGAEVLELIKEVGGGPHPNPPPQGEGNPQLPRTLRFPEQPSPAGAGKSDFPPPAGEG